MKQYCFKIQSKNEKSLKNFLIFFFKYLKTKFNTIQRLNSNKTNKKVITFLKSPHANKTAQEHFEVHLFKRKVQVKGAFLEKNLIFFKKISAKLFQDIFIQIEFLTNEKINKKNNLSMFNPNNRKFSKKNSFKKNLKRNAYKTNLKSFNNKRNSLFNFIKFLKTMSVFGELTIVSSLEKQ